MSSWFLYVPSKANIADLPSRHDYELLRKLGSSQVRIRIPPFEAWDQPASAWLDRAEAGVEAEAAAARRAGERRGQVAVANLRCCGPPREGDVRVDWSPAGAEALANPFLMRGGAGRVAACQACDEVMEATDAGAVRRVAHARGLECVEELEELPQEERREALDALARRVARGMDVRLLCWCYPLRCHADGIARVVRARAEEIRQRAARKRVR